MYILKRNGCGLWLPHYLNIFSFIRYLKNNTIIYYLVSVYTEEKLIFGMVAEKSKR